MKNDDERLAHRYLLSLGLAPIYEPDGNVPPDFLVDGRIAVEVRRLNQNEVTESGEPCGLEEAQFRLLSIVRGVLRGVGPSRTGESWFVTYDFARPTLPSSEIKRRVREFLEAFRDGQTQCRKFCITDAFALDLTPSTEAFADCFVLGGYGDHDSGGFLVHELEKNIRICVREKTDKIARVRTRYPEWWLILIDHIGYGARELLHVEHDWDKVILVNPLDPTLGYEISSA